MTGLGCDYQVRMDMNPWELPDRYRVRVVFWMNGTETQVAEYTGNDRNRLVNLAIEEAHRRRDVLAAVRPEPKQPDPEPEPAPGHPTQKPCTLPMQVMRHWHPAHRTTDTWSISRKLKEQMDTVVSRGDRVRLMLMDQTQDGRWMHRYTVPYDPADLVWKETAKDRFWLLPVGTLHAAGDKRVTKHPEQ